MKTYKNPVSKIGVRRVEVLSTVIKKQQQLLITHFSWPIYAICEHW